MKRFFIITAIVLLSIFLFLFLSTSSVESESYFEQDYYKNTIARMDSIKSNLVTVTDSVQAGFAKVSITPTLNANEDNFEEGKFISVPLAGYGARKGKASTGIHDSIFVKAVALKIGQQTVVFVGADLLIMPPNVIDSVSVLLAKKGIDRERILFSATHTHSSLGGWGAGYVGKMFAGEENINLERWLALRIATAVQSALADLKPARIGTGNFSAGAYTTNRLIGKSGNKNNDFSFIVLQQMGHKRAVIGSYSAHATTLGADNLEISADYPGYWERKMEAASVECAVFFAGSVGSQSPRVEGEGFNCPQRLGEALADSLIQRLPKVILNDTITSSFVAVKMQLPEYHIRLSQEINLATVWSKKLLPLSDNAYLQAIRLGKMIWITTPADFSGEFALQLKNSLDGFGFNANVTSFNGSYVGYVVPGRYFFLDKYEPKTMGWFGPDMGEYTMELVRHISRAITNLDNI